MRFYAKAVGSYCILTWFNDIIASLYHLILGVDRLRSVLCTSCAFNWQWISPTAFPFRLPDLWLTRCWNINRTRSLLCCFTKIANHPQWCCIVNVYYRLNNFECTCVKALRVLQQMELRLRPKINHHNHMKNVLRQIVSLWKLNVHLLCLYT